jgi:septal ring factor EnvC (AmiA/AmiB activator)
MCGRTALFLLLSALPWASWGQQAPSLLDNLDRMGVLLSSIEQTNSGQEKQLQALNESLERSENELAASKQAIAGLQNTLERSESELTASKQAIAGLQDTSETQKELLAGLQFQLEQKQMISEAQSRYTRRLQIRSRVFTVSLIVGIPAVIAGTAWITRRICK